MNSRFIALHCGEDAEALLANHPSAFLLLTQIAMRARWKDSPCPITKLKPGEAFIGDWRSAGLHSEKAYRHAKKILADCNLATFRGASKGTVATLLDSRVFSVSSSSRGEQTGEQGADKGRTRGGQGATKHTDKTEHTENLERESTRVHAHEIGSKPFDPTAEQAQQIVSAYPRREKVADALAIVYAHLMDGDSFEAMLAGTKAAAAVIRTLPSGASNRYVPGAEAFFRSKRWADDPETLKRQGNAKSGTASATDDELIASLGGRAVNLDS